MTRTEVMLDKLNHLTEKGAENWDQIDMEVFQLVSDYFYVGIQEMNKKDFD